MNRNVLYLAIGALALATAFFGYQLYQDRQKTTGVECGLASVFSTVSEETASGEDTREQDLTAAHRSLPFGTLVRVDNRENGRSAVVRITDHGPFITGRILDVSQVAARQTRIFWIGAGLFHHPDNPENRRARELNDGQCPLFTQSGHLRRGNKTKAPDDTGA